MSLLPNARTTIAAISSTLALTAPSLVSAESAADDASPENAFQEFALELADKKSWESADIERTVALWDALDAEQRYSARRYTGFNELLNSASSRAREFRELAEVSTLSESLLLKAREIDQVTEMLLNQ